MAARTALTEAAFPADLALEPVRRGPTVLPDETVAAVMSADPRRITRPVPAGPGQPRASIAVVTFNGLVFTRLCLESVLASTDEPSFELVVVDNGSVDGTAEYLTELAGAFPEVRVILNQENRGFAPAVNQALEEARGEILVLLNNDTIVPAGWLRRLDGHLADPEVALAGPVTNRIGNEAEIDVDYATYGEFRDFADRRARDHDGESLDIPEPIMFCAALRRDVYERVGALDERFELGLFEDSDYALRCHRLGLRTVCAEDVFVHHFGGTSFGQIFPNGEHMELFERNRERFELKWGEPWRPHRRRERPEYTALCDRIRAAVVEATPPGATVAVVSRGDDDLLLLDDREGRHFPCSAGGSYAGVYPADSGEAISQVEEARADGARFLVLPATALWWLEHYEGLQAHLAASCEIALSREDVCVVFDMAPGAGGRAN
jgi:GT2 family glycosyltransferase